MLITLIFGLFYFISNSIFNNTFILSDFILEYFIILLSLFVIFFFIIQWNIERIVKKDIIRLIKEISKDTDLNNDISNLNLDAATIDLIKLIQARTTEINVLKDQDSYRKEFLGNVSHELKTPLFTIQGYILSLIHI